MNDKKAKALRDALKEIKSDPAGFKADPKGKVKDLDDDAANVFKNMSDAELACVAQTDDLMEKAGFTHDIGGVTLRMV